MARKLDFSQLRSWIQDHKGLVLIFVLGSFAIYFFTSSKSEKDVAPKPETATFQTAAEQMLPVALNSTSPGLTNSPFSVVDLPSSTDQKVIISTTSPSGEAQLTTRLSGNSQSGEIGIATTLPNGTYIDSTGKLHNSDGSQFTGGLPLNTYIGADGKLYNADGTLYTGKLPVGTYLGDDGRLYNSDGTLYTTTLPVGVYVGDDGRLYNSDGSLYSGELPVGTFLDDSGRIFNSDGTPYTGGLPLNTYIGADGKLYNADGTLYTGDLPANVYIGEDGRLYNADGTLFQSSLPPDTYVGDDGKLHNLDGSLYFKDLPSGVYVGADGRLRNADGTIYSPNGLSGSSSVVSLTDLAKTNSKDRKSQGFATTTSTISKASDEALIRQPQSLEKVRAIYHVDYEILDPVVGTGEIIESSQSSAELLAQNSASRDETTSALKNETQPTSTLNQDEKRTVGLILPGSMIQGKLLNGLLATASSDSPFIMLISSVTMPGFTAGDYAGCFATGTAALNETTERVSAKITSISCTDKFANASGFAIDSDWTYGLSCRYYSRLTERILLAAIGTGASSYAEAQYSALEDSTTTTDDDDNEETTEWSVTDPELYAMWSMISAAVEDVQEELTTYLEKRVAVGVVDPLTPLTIQVSSAIRFESLTSAR
jgi:hypothetical protein